MALGVQSDSTQDLRGSGMSPPVTIVIPDSPEAGADPTLINSLATGRVQTLHKPFTEREFRQLISTEVVLTARFRPTSGRTPIVGNVGIRRVESAMFLVLWCNRCGHMQQFRRDILRRDPWRTEDDG